MESALLIFDIVATLCAPALILTLVIFHNSLGWLVRPNASRLWFGFVVLVGVRHSLEFAGADPNACRLFGKAVTIVLTLAVIRLSVPMVILVTGYMSNGIAVAANGMVMPVLACPGAEELLAHTQSLRHALADASTRFIYLCDIIPMYADGELLYVQSVGDVLINLGIVLLWYRVIRWFITYVRTPPTPSAEATPA